jgi:hypothetical protein
MYNGWASAGRETHEWITDAQAFLDEAFSKVKGPKDSKTTWRPCSCCGNSHHLTKVDMASHLYRNGFTRDYSKLTRHVKPVE